MLKPRELALKILFDIEKNKAYLNISFQNHIDEAGLPARDAAFVKELTYGVMQQRLYLDFIIESFSSVKMKKISPCVLSCLRMGLYQLFFMDKVPASAAVNESVKLAKKYGHGASAGFTNAILRKAEREGAPRVHGEKATVLSFKTSHPLTLTKWYIDTFGAEKAEHILKQNNVTAPLFLRINSLKTNRKSLLESLAEAGISCREAENARSAILVLGGNVQGTNAYREGLFTVQDEHAQLAALALSPAPNETVLDLCAAPGGKTTHMAELMENKGEILALDIYEKRLQSVHATAKRLGISIISTKEADAKSFTCEKQADKILADVPCSGLGVVRRRPDIKYKDAITDFSELVRIQAEILENSARLLKPGGVLVYSTCTVNPAENEEQVNAFLKRHPDFCLDAITNELITGNARATLQNGMGTFYPEENAGDGFFIARLKRSQHA